MSSPSRFRRLMHAFRHEWTPWRLVCRRRVYTIFGTLNAVTFNERKCLFPGCKADESHFYAHGDQT